MRHHGRSVQSSSDVWDQVVGKSMFLIFDDIEDQRDAVLLQEIADSNGMGESRFLLTSRDTQCALRKCEEDIADLEQRVWAKLKLSYDKLPGDEVKNMFLDIACFFLLDPYWRANDAMKAWSVIYGCPLNRIKILEDRSLLKVSRSKDHEGFDYMEFH
ncbi:hypothetical protein R1flu_013185 [Riccia fluitans]|uniref:NB-ARC domain-containing protein n=1 Tax=Riccia fluitans TaxID=41844 RepID=A0ABD1XF18_9MARC